MSDELKKADFVVCPACDAKRGYLHEMGCEMESCPFCGGQLVSCDCVYEKLGLFDKTKYNESTSFLPPDIYEQGLTEEQELLWDDVLAKTGRLPWISYPNVCAKCGQLSPKLFMVDTPVWEHYIEPRERDKVICRRCFDFIRDVTDRHSGRPKMDVIYRKKLGGPPLEEDIESDIRSIFAVAKDK